MRFPNVLAVYTFLFFFATISIDTIIPFFFYFFVGQLADAFDIQEKKYYSRRYNQETWLCKYSRIPMTQTLYLWASSDNRRIWLYTSVCHYSPLSLTLSLWCLVYVCVCVYRVLYPADTHTHTRSLDTAVSLFRHHPQLFCPSHQKSVVFFLFKPFNLVSNFFSPFSSFSSGLLFGLKGRVKTQPSTRTYTKRTWSNLMQQHGPSVLIFRKLFFFNHLDNNSAYRPDVFFFNENIWDVFTRLCVFLPPASISIVCTRRLFTDTLS